MSSKNQSKQRLAFLSAAMSLMGASMAFGAGGAISITSAPTLNLGASGLTQGLIGTVWHLPPTGPAGSGNYGLPAAGDPALTDLTSMETYINSGSSYNGTTATTYTLPAASETFLNTADKFTYTSTGGSNFWSGYNTAAYLGADAAGATLTDPAPWVNSIVDQMGYIKIASAGTYNFTFKSADDAADVFIGGTGITPSGNAGTGTQIVAASYDSNVIPTSNYTASVSFSSAGYYPIEIMNYQEGGGANMNFSVTAPTGGTAPTYWTTSALASSVTPATPPPTPSPAPAPTDEWNFGKSTISGTSVSDIGSSATAGAQAGTIVGSNTSVVGTQLVTTTTNAGNGMTVPGSTFTGYTGDFTVSVTFTRSANDPTNSWDSVFSFGTQNTPGAGFVLFQPHRNDGSGVASVSFQPSTGGSTGLINGNGQSVAPNVLTQEVLVYSAATNTASLYENGVLQESGKILLPAGVTSFNLASYAKYVGIGGVDPFNDPSLMGSYNDFSTWNSALTAGQVSSLYSTAVPEPAAVALFGLGAVGMLLVKRRRSAVNA